MYYRFANSADRQAVLDFIDMVFSKVRKPHDFETLLPKAYAPYVNKMPIHALAIADGVIRGCVGVYTFPLTLYNETLSVGYVGSVSVHKSVRGQGVMGKLMQMQIARARAEGVDMIVLGGQRQRYEHFGFAPCGGYYQYSVTAANVRKALADEDISGLSFQMLSHNTNDADEAYSLYKNQIVSGARERDSFVDTAKSFGGMPWSVKHEGEFWGYIISSTDKSSITELVPVCHNNTSKIVKAWIVNNNIGALSVRVAPWETQLNRTLAAYAEGYTLSLDGMLLCLNVEKVISAYMRLQSAIYPLSNNTLTLQIDDSPTLRISVDNNIAHVELSRETADLQLSWPQAAKLLFGFNRFCAPETGFRIPSDWFPLPLCIPIAETF